MTTQHIQRALWVALWTLSVACVDTGTSPGSQLDAVSEDVVEDVISSIALCDEDEPGVLQCHDDVKLQVCTEADPPATDYWHTVVTCKDDTTCFDGKLYPEPSCMPRFDCYEGTVHLISCEYGQLGSQDRGACITASIDHTDDTTVIDCYDNNCQNSDAPYECVIAACSDRLQTCLTVDNERPPECPEMPCGPMPAGPDLGCVGLATCYEGCPAKCATSCGADATCLPGCIVTEQKACRGSAPVDQQIAFIELGACQLGNCAAVSDDKKNACMWTHCATETASCMASSAMGDQPCGETFLCMVSSLHFDGVTQCITQGTQAGTEDALELLACFILKTAQGAPCEEMSGDTLKTCIATECVEEALACPVP
jgi:hypothetical protein